MTVQLLDLRSAITKEASNTMTVLAQEIGDDLEPLAHRFISSLCLFKMLNSGTKVISEYGNKCILAIIHHVRAPKVIAKIQEELKSKNPNIRVKSGIYLLVMLKKFEPSDIEKYMSETEDIIMKLMQDASNDARFYARLNFFEYKNHFPERADMLMLQMDGYMQKSLMDH